LVKIATGLQVAVEVIEIGIIGIPVAVAVMS